MAGYLLLVSCLHISVLTFVDPAEAVTSSHMATPNSTLDYLERTIHGLDLALNFFKREHRHVNLDALIGTRMVEATFTVLLHRLIASDLLQHIPTYIVDNIRQLHKSAKWVSDVATPYIMANEPEYFKDIGPIISEGLFELDYKSRDLPKDLPMWTFSTKESMKGYESDACLSEVFGNRNGVQCDISKKCWTRMTNLGYSQYSLSHEIFYLEIAEGYGCEAEMQLHIEMQNQPGISELQDVFCGNMFREAQLFSDLKFPAELRDLFTEQVAMCGMLGYRDFFTSEWLDTILSWQDPNDGCYRLADWPLQKHLKNNRPSRYEHHVVKREEKRVGRGCLCHFTTVASAALAQYTRYVLEVWLQEQGVQL